MNVPQQIYVIFKITPRLKITTTCNQIILSAILLVTINVSALHVSTASPTLIAQCAHQFNH